MLSYLKSIISRSSRYAIYYSIDMVPSECCEENRIVKLKIGDEVVTDVGLGPHNSKESLQYPKNSDFTDNPILLINRI